MSQLLEVRGRGHSWRVYYPNETRLAYPVQVYDREGELKEVLMCGSSDEGMTEAHFVGSQSDALEYAGYLCPGSDVRVVKKMSPAECLQRARKAKEAA